jgi:hypothetical protein
MEIKKQSTTLENFMDYEQYKNSNPNTDFLRKTFYQWQWREMQKLDQEGVFSINQPREQVYINVECIPNDNSDVDRALLLNEAKNIQEWLKDNPKVEG